MKTEIENLMNKYLIESHDVKCDSDIRVRIPKEMLDEIKTFSEKGNKSLSFTVRALLYMFQELTKESENTENNEKENE